MTEKRKFKVLWFAAQDGDVKRNARSCFEEAAEKIGCDYDADFEHDFVWPMEDRAATKHRIASTVYDLVIVAAEPLVAEYANDFCANWTTEQLAKVVLWQLMPRNAIYFKKKLRAAPVHVIFFGDGGFEDWVRIIVHILAAAKR